MSNEEGFYLRAMSLDDRDEASRPIFHSTNQYYVSIGRQPVFNGDELSACDIFDVYERIDPGEGIVAVDEEPQGIDGFLAACGSNALNMIGPGVARTQEQAAALFYDQLNHQQGRCPVLLVPVTCGDLVRQLYDWGARNCEMHVAQSHGPAQTPAGIVIPTFLPESA